MLPRLGAFRSVPRNACSVVPERTGCLGPEPRATLVDPMPSLVRALAVIRAESNFNPTAVSNKNAQGLMQLLPSTAKLVARKEGMASYNLMKAEDNIRLGIGFMHDIMNNYTADYVGIAIAYNAGPGRYTQWKDKYSNDDDIFIEEIPFQETYHYVRVLLADRAKYRAILQK